MEIRISDFDHYTTEMKKSLIDKMFFMDKLDGSVRAILDFGCADGQLIGFLAALFPEEQFAGYDLSPDMVAAARENCKGLDNAVFFSDFNETMSFLREKGISPAETAVNLSSLIHEVYSYGTPDSIEEFWHRINDSGFGYITIRDMCLDRTAHRPALKEDVLKVRRGCSAEMIEDFEKRHGSLSDNYNLIHFLMKYRYIQNWERECAEDYLPLTLDRFAGNLSDGYEIIYFDHYILPFLAGTVKKDIGITLKDYTHIKFILKKK